MASVSGWAEGILFSLLFLSLFGLVVAGFNLQYGRNYSLGVSDNTTQTKFIRYMNTSETQIKGGEVAFDAQQGISLKSSYGMAKTR